MLKGDDEGDDVVDVVWLTMYRDEFWQRSNTVDGRDGTGMW